MSAKTITFGNFKGGTGKTTNATMVGYELSNQGKNTLLIDLDPQANATNLYLKTKINFENDITSFKQTLMSAIQKENIESAIINIKQKLDILPSAADFSLYPRYMEKINDYNERVQYLNKLITPLKEKYDFIIIDIPPTISLITDSALYMSDYCIIVLQTHERSLQGAEAFINYIQNEVIDTYHAPTLEILGVLPVLLKNGAPVDIATLENAKKIFGKENIFKTTIKNMERLKRYDLTGITDEDMHDKRVFNAYKLVTNETLERIEVFENE
ncbi:ParA family protein [Enterococcus faecalis]|uniref:ParA family protein n=1 Tax=Enterococcus faecalis TaxID=1351 RepID=UPI0021E010BD|nr:AAA family ATPase [Enterococcus faecalis]MCU9780980.1 AAA family ATPase [Enterococcus faecalis]